MTRPRPFRPRLLLALLVVLLGSVAAWAQEAPGDAAATEPSAPEPVPAIASFGVQFGFPAYRTAGVTAGVQARFVGLAVRVGGGPGGVAVGVQGRAYLPLPIPVPTFLGAGVDVYAGRFAPHVVLGLHVPVAERWRLDVEGGVAWTPLLDDVRVTPYLGIGASYALAVGLTPSTSDPVAASATGASSSACVPGPPNRDALDAAVATTVRRFVSDAVATYGSVYRDLRYRTSVRTISVDGNFATMGVAYDGSVVEILTGREITASGEAEVDFRWDGCRWLRTDLRY
jgi:hypothetical protein